MTRRKFTFHGAATAFASCEGSMVLPIHQVVDARSAFTAGELVSFSNNIWAEAARDFRRCGIELQSKQVIGEVRRSPSEKPIFTRLSYRAINLVLTRHIPMEWDNGRGLTGVATRYEGYDLCVVALRYAHGHQIPLLSVNTCVHEMLHVLFNDVAERRPKGFEGEGREFRIDLLATRLWLLHDGEAIRRAARAYLAKLSARHILD